MKLVLTALLFAVFPFLASATTITSGTITVTKLMGPGYFDFGGPGFSVSGEFVNVGFGDQCSPCLPNTVLTVSGNMSGNDFLNGSGTVGTTTFDGLDWGDMEQAYPGTTVFNVSGPSLPLGAVPGVYQGTFSFNNGSLCGTHLSDNSPRPCLVNLKDLNGSGIVDVTVIQGPVGLETTTTVYTFTPEPQTWLLAFVGIIALLGWRLLKVA